MRSIQAFYRTPTTIALGCWLLLVATMSITNAFVVTPPLRSQQHSTTNTRLFAAATMPTLTEATTWNVRLILRGLTSAQGVKLDPLVYTMETQFIEDQDYEPPQGTLQVVTTTAKNNTIPILKSRWILSEDPNDRKDGLWVWGLFKEPLYPFLLLTLQTDAIPIMSSKANDSTDFVPAMQLYAQINHRRDDGKVILEGKDLCWRQMETVRADPLGAATVDLYDNVVVGTIALQPKQ